MPHTPAPRRRKRWYDFSRKMTPKSERVNSTRTSPMSRRTEEKARRSELQPSSCYLAHVLNDSQQELDTVGIYNRKASLAGQNRAHSPSPAKALTLMCRVTSFFRFPKNTVMPLRADSSNGRQINRSHTIIAKLPHDVNQNFPPTGKRCRSRNAFQLMDSCPLQFICLSSHGGTRLRQERAGHARLHPSPSLP